MFNKILAILCLSVWSSVSMALELANLLGKFDEISYTGYEATPVTQKIVIPKGTGILKITQVHQPWQNGRSYSNRRDDSIQAQGCRDNYSVCSGWANIGYTLNQYLYVRLDGFKRLTTELEPDPWKAGENARSVDQFHFTATAPVEMIVGIWPQANCGGNGCYQFASESQLLVEWLDENSESVEEVVYDFDTGELTLPKVSAGDGKYRIIMKNNGDFVFTIKEINTLTPE